MRTPTSVAGPAAGLSMLTAVAVVGLLLVSAGPRAASHSTSPNGDRSSEIQVRDAGPRPTGTAALGGRVTRDNAPIARAMVALNAGDGRGDRQTATDDEGRFLFDGLPAGRFALTASKAGWVHTYYGSTRPGRPPGVRVALEDGKRVDVEIPLVPGAVIAGRMVDEDGQPMARQYPWLLEYRMVGGRRLLVRARPPASVGFFERSTDDRGEFRLFGLPPGTYYLVVNPTITAGARLTTSAEVRWAMQPPGSPGGTAPPPGAVAGYASLYYPGTPEPASATPIVLGPGEVRDGLVYRVSFVPVARITGMVHRQDGAPAAGAVISMATREMLVSLEGSGRRATADRDGRFVFQNVPPGDYRISARGRSTPAGPAPAPAAAGAPPGRPTGPVPTATPTLDLWGQADVVVSGQDVTDVGVVLAPASTIAGRLVFDGATSQPPSDLTTVRLQFVAGEALVMAMTGAGSGGALNTATVAADGTFRVEGLPPDRYLVSATWPGMRTGDGTTGWWLTTIQVEGRDLGDAPIDVAPNAAVRDVRITFRDRIAAIEGILTDAAGRPAPEYYVLAFPVERTSWSSLSRRAVPPTRPGTDGRFRLTGLPAGEYYLAVVTSIESDEATDPAFLEALVQGAIRITLAEGETRRQDLRIGR